MTVWLRGSCPFSTVARWMPVGKWIARSLNCDDLVPVDGSEPTYCASSGSDGVDLERADHEHREVGGVREAGAGRTASILARSSEATISAVSGCEV